MGGKIVCWTEDDINFVKENYNKMSTEEIAKHLGRTKGAVGQLASKKLKIKIQHHKFKIGDKFFRLEVIGEIFYKKVNHSTRENYRQAFVQCECECGKILDVRVMELKQGSVKSCGCYNNELRAERASKLKYKHGKGNNKYRIYRIWSSMKTRCYLETSSSYKDYGGRGIKICDEWLNDFEVFEKWSLENGYTNKLSIERENVDGNYTPDNCKWTDQKEQAINKTNNRQVTAFGETKPLACWSRDERCVVDYSVLINRLNRGWDSEKSLTTPLQNTHYKKPKSVKKQPRKDSIWIEAFGEKKILVDWTRDPRAKVNRSTLSLRIRKGWNPETAITTPPLRLRSKGEPK